MAHIEDMPKLGKYECQEWDRHCRSLIQLKPEMT